MLRSRAQEVRKPMGLPCSLGDISAVRDDPVVEVPVIAISSNGSYGRSLRNATP